MEHHNFASQKPDLESTISKRRAFGFVARLLMAYPLSVIGVVLLSIAAALSEMMNYALLLPFIESLRDESTSSISEQIPIGFLTPYFADLSLVAKIRIIAVCLHAVQVVKGGATFLSARISYLLQIKVDRKLRLIIFDQLLDVGMGYIHKQKIANLFTILNNYTGNTSKMALFFVSIVPDVFITLISVAILASISLPMTAIVIVFAFITSLTLGRFSKLAGIYGKACNYAQVRLNHIGFEILSGMALIRLFAREDSVRRRFKDSVEEVQRLGYRRSLLEASINPITATMLVLIVALLLFSATFILRREAEFWVGILVLFLLVLSRLGGPIGRMNLVRTQLAGLTPSIQSIMEFLARGDKETLPEGTTEFVGLKESIRLENVAFRYDTGEEDVLTDVSFEIPKGKVTAIVGASGSGKSTLIALLARLYDPTSGQIVVDGVDLRGFKSRTWRRRIGVVSQNPFLFNDTLRNNICFGKPEATDKEIEAAAHQANAHDFIMRMRDGYQTLLGDRGVRLSGGQAQRVAIARAILVDPDLLILDEATSSLDTASERLVQEAIDIVSKNRTVVTIAHRLSTIRDADNIVVLENGRIVEQGTHQELIARKGVYWKYVRLQDLMIQEKSPEPSVEVSQGMNLEIEEDITGLQEKF